jgi:hypothetical protein
MISKVLIRINYKKYILKGVSMPRDITVVDVIRELKAVLEGSNFQTEVNSATFGQIKAYNMGYKERPECVHVFSDSRKIIVKIGDDKYALNEKQINAIMREHMDFFSVDDSCGGIQKIIPVNPKEYPNFKDIVSRITKAYSIAVTM